MLLNNAKDIRIGEKAAQAVYLGEELIWPEGDISDGDLPEEYTRLLAIESAGSFFASPLQLFAPGSTSKVIIDYVYVNAVANQSICVYSAVRSSTVMMRIIANSGTAQSGFSVNTASGKASWVYDTPVKSGVRYIVTAEKNTCSFVPVDASEQTILLTNPDSLYIPDNTQTVSYINSATNSSTGWQKGARYYSVQHYKDGVLANDYIPVLYMPDPEATPSIGMYDRCNGNFSKYGDMGKYWMPVYNEEEV